MKIKIDDLKMLMDYLEKELVEEVDVTVVSANFATYFTFTTRTVENVRLHCTILYETCAQI